MIVADTNLLAYLVLPGERTEAAERVLARDPEWAAPLLWRSEFRNVLVTYLRSKGMGIKPAVEAFDRAHSFVRGREYAGETLRVLECAERSSCSAYDCEFVSLAEEIGVPLVTSDGQVLREFPSTAISMEEFAR
ncbi:type II toxin-antitoxin system VapC family toxin [soil metagenome]